MKYFRFVAVLLILSAVITSFAGWKYSEYLVWPAVLAECFVILTVVFAVYKGSRSLKGKDNVDVWDIARVSLENLVPPKVAHYVVAELRLVASSFRFLFFFPKPQHSSKVPHFTHHQKSSYSKILILTFIGLIVLFAIIHSILNYFSLSSTWHYVFGFFECYFSLWAIGDYRLSQESVHSIKNDVLQLRLGFRLAADIPLNTIESIEVMTNSNAFDGTVPISLDGQTNIFINLKDNITVRNFLGSEKEASSVSVFLDNPERFLKVIKPLIK